MGSGTIETETGFFLELTIIDEIRVLRIRTSTVKSHRDLKIEILIRTCTM